MRAQTRRGSRPRARWEEEGDGGAVQGVEVSGGRRWTHTPGQARAAICK